MYFLVYDQGQEHTFGVVCEVISGNLEEAFRTAQTWINTNESAGFDNVYVLIREDLSAALVTVCSYETAEGWSNIPQTLRDLLPHITNSHEHE